MKRLTLTLPKREHEALLRLADREWRHPRDQAVLLIRRALEELGCLEAVSRQPEAQNDGSNVREQDD